jgi:hypothetical protein
MYRYFNPSNYARYAQILANRYLLEPLEIRFSPKPNVPLRHPPIFFLGPPRSGSTLAIQAITEALDVGYLSNRHCDWCGAPALAERLLKPTNLRLKTDFHSLYGDTQGAHAPAECGEWWHRFFRRSPQYVSLAEVDPRKINNFRRSIASLINAFDRPVIFKNLYASFRIQAIAQYLPESLFIVMRRNEIDNGHSILEARHRVNGNYARWWSMEPPGIDHLQKLPAHQQVIEQIRHVRATIYKDLIFANVDPTRYLDLSYESFCTDPREAIKTIHNFFLRNNCKITRRSELPINFSTRQHVRIDPDIYEAMVRYAQGFDSA